MQQDAEQIKQRNLSMADEIKAVLQNYTDKEILSEVLQTTNIAKVVAILAEISEEKAYAIAAEWETDPRVEAWFQTRSILRNAATQLEL